MEHHPPVAQALAAHPDADPKAALRREVPREVLLAEARVGAAPAVVPLQVAAQAQERVVQP